LPLPSTLTSSPPPSCRRPSFLSCPRPAICRPAPRPSPHSPPLTRIDSG
jgi:hypothetical protein